MREGDDEEKIKRMKDMRKETDTGRRLVKTGDRDERESVCDWVWLFWERGTRVLRLASGFDQKSRGSASFDTVSGCHLEWKGSATS